MVRLPEEIITTVLGLQRQLLERLDKATATEFELLTQYGETEATLLEFDSLQNVKERVNTYYSRFYTTLRRIYEAQPFASRDTLELLARFIDEAEATTAATDATIREKRQGF